MSVAAIARVTTPELIEAVQPGTDGHEAYKWLADRSFSEPLADGIALHTLVAEAVRAMLRDRDPTGEGALRRRIADFLYERALAGQFSLSADLQHLVVDPDVKWGYSADVGSRYRIDELRPGDIEAIGSILHSVGLDEWWEITSAFFRRHPEFVGIARDGDGGVGVLRRGRPGQCAGRRRDRHPARTVVAIRAGTLQSDNAGCRGAVEPTGGRGEVTACSAPLGSSASGW